MRNSFAGGDFLSIRNLSRAELETILTTAAALKKKSSTDILKGKTVALIFEKPSLRTKVSFDVAVERLGGHSVFLTQAEVGLGHREPNVDIARVLSRYVDAIVVRTFLQKNVEELAEYANVPVINALTNEEHPCQALADLLTILEQKGKLKGIRIAYIGDGNNVATSLAQAATLVGAHFIIASPEEYRLPRGFVSGAITETDSPEEAVKGADVIYTDVWTSMGQEAESEKRRKAFKSYQVTPALMRLAKHDAIFMHDLPAHRGEEVADEVIESRQSVVFDQAENRLHTAAAVLALVLPPLRKVAKRKK